MQNFDYMTPTRLIFGEGVVKNLPEVMKPIGKKNLAHLRRPAGRATESILRLKSLKL